MIYRLKLDIMKKTMIMLLVAGFATMQTAQAQTNESNENFPVCRVNGEYKICDHDHSRMNHSEEMVEKQMPCDLKVVKVQPVTDVVFMARSNKDNPRFKVSYDMPGDVYEGKEVLSNDGVANNKRRNLNYLDWSVTKAPNSGMLPGEE